MSALQHILAAEPSPEGPPGAPSEPQQESTSAPPMPLTSTTTTTRPEEQGADTPGKGDEPVHTSTTLSSRRNASGSVSSVYSGNKIKHLKKEDGIPLWRKDIQYDFLRLVFYDKTECFTKYSDGTKGHPFAEVYIDAMAKSSKCSKILKEKLLQDTEGAISMAMVCLLVNVGRMNTTLNFFPEMRAQLRTYHSIPALQAHQDPNAYKQLQDAPRLKSILKGATEDEPQPSTMEEIKAARLPRTNPVNLIFVMSQYAPKISETHFQPPRDFFDLVMRGSLSSASRARAFLWLIWWYLESDFSAADALRNPFGPGQYGEGEEGTGVSPLKVPPLESLTEEQAAVENVDTEEEEHFGEVKRKERIAILASEPSPAMTALKRARKEKAMEERMMKGAVMSDDDGNEQGWYKAAPGEFPSTKRKGRAIHLTSLETDPLGVAPPVRGQTGQQETGSEYTRSPSPAANRSFQAVNAPAKPVGDMRINNLLNDEGAPDASPPASAGRKGPGRGNWRRSKPKQETVPFGVRGTDGPHHVPLLPNPGQLSFVNEAPHASIQPATPGSGAYGPYSGNMHLSPQQSTNISFQPPNTRDHIPTPSYQAQKRNRGVTQHQSAVINHRKQQINYTLDRRIRKLHGRARDRREGEGCVFRAWKRIRYMPADYDSEEEAIRVRKARDRTDKDDDWRLHKGKDTADATEDLEAVRRPRILLAGLVRVNGDSADIGEEAKTLARTFRRASRRLERWEESNFPGQAVIRRRQLHLQGLVQPKQRSLPRRSTTEYDGMDVIDEDTSARRSVQRQRSGTGRTHIHRSVSEMKDYDRGVDVEPDDDDGGGELDEEDRELLGEVDADESDEDEDDEQEMY